jgi:DNA polymerase elongation subunit (family B)
MYAIHKHEPGKPPKLSVSGLKPARRDNAPMLKTLFMDVLKTRLVEQNPSATVISIMNWLEKVKNNEIPMEDYHITTAIGRNYANPNLLQPMLQRKIREKGGICDSGDRIHYVVTKTGGQKVAEKAQSPDYCTLEDIDRVWYVQNHVKECILELCEIFNDVNPASVSRMFEKTCVSIQQEEAGQSQLERFFKPLKVKKKPEKRKGTLKEKKLKQGRITKSFFG